MGEMQGHLAASKGRLDDLKKFVESGQNVALQDITGSLPIHHAAKGAYVNCVAYLLEGKLNDMNFKNFEGNTPLHYATVSGTKKVTALFVEAGADLNPLNKMGQTPLHGAVGQRWDHVVAYLGSKRDSECKDCAKKKCQRHVDINAQDAHGRTPLHYASRLYFSGVYELLLELGADPSIKDDSGAIPKSPAVQYQQAFNENAFGVAAMTALLVAIVYALFKQSLDEMYSAVRDYMKSD
eukprot:TRINITY_DN21098_c0_g1_i1.p1 TRINITY_DN21098_c0_g1~~TRINITY_DN21098_c0_g1_i1.p1  ORF type:complete len:238 (-),score=54.59 TRINITY_DN21098_c0_g1_i1:1000-1713(-)